MRLDADLIARTPSYLNPLKDRELDLRGYQIPAIENLGVTKDGVDSIDFTDNAITSLSNFPHLRRLQHLNLANNPVRTMSATVPTSLPNLKTLVLANSQLPQEALALVGTILSRFSRLETVVLKGSPLAKAKYYREWIVFSCERLRAFDYERVRDQERKDAHALFMTPDGSPTALHNSFKEAANSPSSGIKESTFEPGLDADSAAARPGRVLTKEEKDRVRQAISMAESVDEIKRLQKMLAQGYVPSEKDLKELNRRRIATD